MAALGLDAVRRLCILGCTRRSLCSLYRLSGVRRLASSSNASDGNGSSDVSEKPKLELAKPTRKRVRNPEKNSSESSSSSSSSEDEGLDPNLVTAAKSVAEAFPGSEVKVESDLLQRLRLQARAGTDQQEETPVSASVDASDMLSGMKIDSSGVMEDRGKPRDRGPQRDGITPGQPRGRSASQYQQNQYKLFEGKRLQIFNIENLGSELTETGKASLWDTIKQEEVDKLIDRPPSDAFEEVIQWTKQGKMWQFPINNEQGWEEEANVPFHEHVFLEKHLKGFPKSGPLRHFMELVTVGLSKNPYMSVQQKIGHINWYREYFSDKMDIIEESIKLAKSAAASS